MLVFLDGRFLARDDARLSALDAGVQHAVGLFETMTARNGRVFRGERHVERLADSATALGLAEGLRTGPLLEAVELTLQRNELLAARVRLTITGGDLNLLHSTGRSAARPTVLVVAQPPTGYPPALFERGALAVVAGARLNPLDPTAGHKTLAYWPRLIELQRAAAAGAGEALWFDVGNRLAGGCVSNVFLVKDGEVHTPPARGEVEEGTGDPALAARPSGVLPGVTRAAILELAAEQGIAARKRPLTIDDVLAADECFLTNSSWGVLPIRQVEQHEVGGGEPGPVTRLLRAGWLALVEGETLPGG